MDHFFRSIYCVIRCVKTKRVLKRKFASSVSQNCMQRCKKKKKIMQICVTGPQCVKTIFRTLYLHPKRNFKVNVWLTVHHSTTNIMHFLFNLLRINALCMIWALLVHPQEMLDKRHLVCCVRVVSGLKWWNFNPSAANWLTRMQYTNSRFGAPPEDEQVMLKTCKGH
jgi:hypothetical protein